MESDAQANPVPLWYVGLHDSNRMLPITEEVLRAAQSANVSFQTDTVLNIEKYECSKYLLV
jgi:cellobiose-specific phosphotransferase system component IIC